MEEVKDEVVTEVAEDAAEVVAVEEPEFVEVVGDAEEVINEVEPEVTVEVAE